MKLLIILLISISLSSCASLYNLLDSSLNPVYKVETHYDDIENFTTHRTNEYRLTNPQNNSGSDIQIYVHKIIKEPHVLYSLVIYYKNYKGYWLFIEKENSLILLIDNEKIELSATDTSIGSLESANYHVSPEILRKIAYASEIKLRLKGRRGYKDAIFNSKLIQVFRQFYEEYVKENNK